MPPRAAECLLMTSTPLPSSSSTMLTSTLTPSASSSLSFLSVRHILHPSTELPTTTATSAQADDDGSSSVSSPEVDSCDAKKRRGRKKLQVKPVFSCGSCQKGFPRKEHMLRHERSHTGEKPFTCLFEGCHKTFSRFDNMMPHFRHHYGFGRTQDFEVAEAEIPLLKHYAVDELKNMSKAKSLRSTSSQSPTHHLLPAFTGKLSSRVVKRSSTRGSEKNTQTASESGSGSQDDDSDVCDDEDSDVCDDDEDEDAEALRVDTATPSTTPSTRPQSPSHSLTRTSGSSHSTWVYVDHRLLAVASASLSGQQQQQQIVLPGFGDLSSTPRGLAGRAFPSVNPFDRSLLNLFKGPL